jgi:hypothetical protein
MRTMKNDIEKMIEHGQKFKALLITPYKQYITSLSYA